MIALIASALCAALAAPQTTDLERRVDTAIDRGLEALLIQQEIDGSWRKHLDPQASGMTALAVYTLLQSGVSPSHPSVKRGLEFMRLHPSEKTYGVACTVMALSEIEAQREGDWLERETAKLLEWQQGDGFGYPEAPIDLSNTQYAALALRSAARAGQRVPAKAWRRIGNALKAYAEDSSGYAGMSGYRYNSAYNPTGSMTASAVMTYAICEEYAKGSTKEYAKARERGLAWLAEHFSVDHNPHPAHETPGKNDGQYARTLYYLYGLERIGALLDLEKIGDHDWYTEGATWLVAKQAPNGRWEGNQPDTCFALLFLNRATRGPVTGSFADRKRQGLFGSDNPSAPVCLRASGKDQLAVWISSFAQPELEAEVQRVVFKARGKRGEPVEFAALDVTADAPQTSRLAAEFTPPEPGEYWLSAVVELNGGHALLAPEIAVRIEPGERPEFLAYATDPERNLLRGLKLDVETSSVAIPMWRGELAVDGYQGTGWSSASSDPRPKLTISLPKAVRTNTLLLSHAYELTQPTPGAGRVVRARVVIDGKKVNAIEFTMEPDVRRKTVVDLGKIRRVRKFSIEVLETGEITNARFGTGFNEVELQLRK